MTDLTTEYPASYGTPQDPRPSLGLILAALEAATAHGPARTTEEPMRDAA